MEMEEMGIRDRSHLSDRDLIQLAGYHGHLNIEDPKIVEVSGTEVEIVDSTHDTATGLDAFVIKEVNYKQEEDFSIVFISDQHITVDSSITDPVVSKDVEKPAQIEAAKTYFECIEEKYGPGTVSSVAGNFNAGALANAIAIEHSDVRSVTLNPALLPWGMTEPGRNYGNITNYYSENDFLTSTEETLGLGNRVPGNKFHIHNGLPSAHQHFARYVEQIDGEFEVPVGIKGEAGYGFIHVGASDHIVTSIWTGVPLYGGPSTKVKLNQSRLYTLTNGLEAKVIARIKLAKGYVEKANDIINHEHSRLQQRIRELQNDFRDAFDRLSGIPMPQGSDEGDPAVHSAMDQICLSLRTAKHKVHSLIENISNKLTTRNEHMADVDVPDLFTSVNGYTQDAKDSVNQFIRAMESVIEHDIPDLFGSKRETNDDTVTGELKDHYSIIQLNMSHILEQVALFEKQVQKVAATLGQDDKSTGVTDLYKERYNSRTTDGICPAINSLESLAYSKQRTKIKKVQVEEADKRINKLVIMELQPLLESAESKMALMEDALSTLLHSIQSTLYTTLDDNTKEEFRGTKNADGEEIRPAIDEAIQSVRKVQKMTADLKKGLTRLISELPEMSDYLKPSIDEAIFDPCHYSNVRLYNIACSSILDELVLLFRDITFQLSSENTAVVQASAEIAKNIKENIKVLRKQVGKGIL